MSHGSDGDGDGDGDGDDDDDGDGDAEFKAERLNGHVRWFGPQRLRRVDYFPVTPIGVPLNAQWHRIMEINVCMHATAHEAPLTLIYIFKK